MNPFLICKQTPWLQPDHEDPEEEMIEEDDE